MRQFNFIVLLAAAIVPAVLFADDPPSAESPAAKSPAEKATDLAVKKGLEWIARQQCVSCHFKVPGKAERLQASKVDGLSFSPDGDYLFSARATAALLLTDKPGACTRDADKKEEVTYLGVFLAPVPDVVRRHVKVPADMGLLVETVDAGSPAQAAGLNRYDVLLKIDEQLLVNPQQFTTVIRTYPANVEVRLEAIVQNEPKTLAAKLIKRELPRPESAATDTAHALIDVVYRNERASSQTAHFWHAVTGKVLSDTTPESLEKPEPVKPRKKIITRLGVHTSPPSEALARQLKLPPGLGLMIESVEEGTAAEKARLKPFDVLQKLDNQLLANTEQFTVLIRAKKPGDEVKLTLIREGKTRVVPVVLGQFEVDADPSDLGEYTTPGGENFSQEWKVQNLNVARWYVAEGKHQDVSDADYIRRVYLDLVGLVPRPEEVKGFLDDTNKDKRRRLVDTLLARPEAISRASGSTAVKWSDPIHQLSFVSKDGARHLTVTNAAGKVLFEGPIDTAEQRRVLPDELAGKLELMLSTEVSRAAQPVAAQDLLHRALPKVEFAEVPFAKVCEQLREMSGANLVVNWKALKQAGVNADEPISLSLRDVRLSTALSTLLSLAGSEKARLGYTVEGEVILISVKAK